MMNISVQNDISLAGAFIKKCILVIPSICKSEPSKFVMFLFSRMSNVTFNLKLTMLIFDLLAQVSKLFQIMSFAPCPEGLK